MAQLYVAFPSLDSRVCCTDTLETKRRGKKQIVVHIVLDLSQQFDTESCEDKRRRGHIDQFAPIALSLVTHHIQDTFFSLCTPSVQQTYLGLGRDGGEDEVRD